MIDWGQILYGAALSTVITAVVLAAGAVIARRLRTPLLLGVALASTFLGPLTWNAILHRAGGTGFFVDIPFKPFPVSWQDTGSGVFTLAIASTLLTATHRHEPAGRIISIAGAVAVIAFLVDIYLY